MDRRLLRYYDLELQHLRGMGAEFAREFPKVAARLGMEGFNCADPFVERLLEEPQAQLRAAGDGRPAELAGMEEVNLERPCGVVDAVAVGRVGLRPLGVLQDPELAAELVQVAPGDGVERGRLERAREVGLSHARPPRAAACAR